MAKDSEKKIEKSLREQIESSGGKCVKQSGEAGMPDRACYLPGGKTVFVETKSTGDKARLLQKIQHQKLRNLGFDVYLIDSFAKLKKFIERYV